MLGRTLVYGLMAAVLIGSAAAVYADVKDNGNRPAEMPPSTAAGQPAATGGDGYIRPTADRPAPAVDETKRSERQGESAERHRRGHDDDDD